MQCDRLVDERCFRCICHLFNTDLRGFAGPYRCGYCQIAIRLCHSDVVVAVLWLKFCTQDSTFKLFRIVPCISNCTVVANHFDLGNRIASVRIVQCHLNIDFFSRIKIFKDCTHRVFVQLVMDFQVLVFRCVNTSFTDCLVDAFLTEIFCQDNITGIIGIAPSALVVVLVVGRRHVPALIKCQRILLIARIISARTDLSFTIADFDQEHMIICLLIPIGEVCEITEGAARMVKLVQGLAVILLHRLIIELHAGITALVVERGVVSGDKTVCVEGVDMTRPAGPCHFIACDCDHIGLFRIELCNLVLVLFPECTAGICHETPVIHGICRVGCAGCIKVVGMIRECDEINIRAFRQTSDIFKRGVQSTGSV